MKDFIETNKALIGIIITTLILVVGGVFLMTKKSPNGTTNTVVVDENLLFSQNSIITSGIVDGKYLDASLSAKVKIAEFGDYECPACIAYHPFITKLLTDFSGKINYTFKNYPLPQHKNAPLASKAVEAAGLQGKYWQMHDKVFENSTNWVSATSPKDIFAGFAKEFSLDAAKFTSDMDSKTIADKIQADTDAGIKTKLTETPTIYINGIKVELDGTYEQLKKLTENALIN